MTSTTKKYIAGIKGFVFDLDGTMIDTTPLVIKHWYQFAEEHGLDPVKILATSHGRRSIETIAEWVPSKATQEHVDYYERRLADETDGVKVLPGVKALLDTIPFGKWGVCTAGTSYMAVNRFKQCGIQIPVSLSTGDKVTHGKPHPEGYLKAAELLNLPPTDCVVFEDAPAGVKAGKAAGMTVIACTTTHTAEQLKQAGADHIVSYLTDVTISVLGDGTFGVQIDQLEI
ncbi:HAD-like domain-containing protein [Halteromyces radiatus]|uniref:HAD-like domain-containing protein n=1 Tax=Halteromyces radiatus TaxID=101107 RepID=UPI0022205886|nr:HAD-like domain-containing protein [Halteromyces radiatus]KAI8089366.1 HAD-like domain-containing protein [Halteromyces radiatus]